MSVGPWLLRSALLAVSAVLLAAAAWPVPAGIKTMTVNGYDLAYSERGSGETLILLHGASNDLRSFELQMEPLAKRFRVISVSLRHYWPEPWSGEGEFSARQQAEDVASFITALGAGPVHLVGHSRGGYIALELALAHPELLRDLVLAEPALLLPGLVPGAAAAESKEVSAARDQRIATTTRLIGDGKIEDASEVWTDGINGKGSYRSRPAPLQQVVRDNIRTVLGEEHEGKRTITCADVQKVTLPVLLMRGEKGSHSTHLALDVLEKCFPDQRHMMIAGAVHTMNRSNPDEFNRAVMEFAAGR
jgi:esterase